MDSRTSTVAPTPSPTESESDRTPSLSPIGFVSPTPCPRLKKTSAEDGALKVSSGRIQLPIRTLITPDADVKASPQPLQQSPEPCSPASGLPRVIIVYQNGCHSRLRSVYDKYTRKYIYHHARDGHKQIRMTFIQGKLESLEDVATKDLIYVRGVTHKKGV
ncbi:hypothetical protein F4811DRAFT_570255 [Daldinia bambusicola]|nr:hypothetical protein F4811DRAFT_570255 [Daldinia bambusicola]